MIGLRTALTVANRTSAFAADPDPMSGIPSVSGAWAADPIVKDKDWLIVPIGPNGAKPLNGIDTPNPNPDVSRKRGRDVDDDANG